MAAHDKQDDCWLVVRNKVYDVSSFTKDHPGGPVILAFAGRDATDVFSNFHGSSTWNLLKKFEIGEYQQEEPTPELLKDFRELRSSMVRNRLFESNKLYYAYKLLSTFSLLIASWTIVAWSTSLLALLTSAFFLALFFQQTGWLAHDFLHHQVFKSRSLNHWIGGYFLGNVAMGFSDSWWTSKHNLHHAAPNECDESYHPVDPDIDTIPILAWSLEMLATVESKTVRSFLRWQQIFFFPVLLFARFSWLHSSWLHALYSPMSSEKRTLETGFLSLHYVWVFGLAFAYLPVGKAILWIMAAEIISGFFLGIVFVQSHNAMEIYAEPKDFYSAQIISTRDIQSSLFNDWFTGGLNRQIEHHLFPNLPRHNLKYITKPVRDLCTKHGLEFEDVSMVTGTSLVMQRLAEVAAAA